MSDTLLFAPELVLLIFGLLLFLCPVFDLSYRLTWKLALVGGALALGAGLWTLNMTGEPFAPGIYRVDFFSQFIKTILALGYLLTIAISHRPQTLDRASWLEYPMFLLLATLGMMMMASATEMLTLYIAMELAAYPLYIAVALHRNPQIGGESSTKYMLQGMVASAISLYGMSFLFGVFATTYFSGISAGLPAAASQPLFWIGLLLLLGFQGTNSKSSSVLDEDSSLFASKGIFASRLARFCGFDKSRFTSTANEGLRDHGKSSNRFRIR